VSAPEFEALVEVLAAHRYSPGIEQPTHGYSPYNATCECGQDFGTWDDEIALPLWEAHVAEPRMALGGERLAEVERSRELDRAYMEGLTIRAERAEAEAHDLAADYDRRGERLWRLAALAGHTPCDSDNDASAEQTITDALADLVAAEQRGAERALRKAADEMDATAIGVLCEAKDGRHVAGILQLIAERLRERAVASEGDTHQRALGVEDGDG
jgi:hypothetical protein